MTGKIRKTLRQHFILPSFLLFEEVKRSAGFMKPERFADAIAISLFPSKGISLTGFEIKTTRQDLLAELRDLQKAEAVKQFCDYWNLVIPGGSDVLDGKIAIPDDWGIWTWWEQGEIGRFVVSRKPKRLYPKPPDRYFLASLLGQTNTAVRAEK